MTFPNGYPTTSDVKATLRPNTQQALGSGDDTIIANCITAAIGFIEGPEGTGRAWEVTSDSTRRFDAVRDADGRTLFLDKDLCQITSITNGDGQVIPSTAYTTKPRNEAPYYAIELKASQAYVWTFVSDPEDAIAIVGRWGHATSAPPDIAQACLSLAIFEYRRRTSSGSDDRPIVTASGSTIVASAVPRPIMQVLWARRKRGL